ncbi:fumarylacetoacetate hydrolase family protein [Actimicrobium sp. CCI2.3]|uniref:2-keto-4-pentenoate hydratase n=1 Tax=Actimicrobium sp. CCI2.3 TaxID=3048616 RepID=UPI002AB41E7C|nr:fumarylacetoacetate hydrolase family protein [Actimicrobium sp. CCI2.3]MDY7575188.1 fumarylacetoacetate hydrolase family protein [Actimicrobium sp. CCI2.3]MEB0022349.1 fumarylacetoacetate hydrolase family protein [Actimicrobium sp. CCI2.3]
MRSLAEDDIARIELAATELVARRRTRRQGAALAEGYRPTDVAAALAIQRAVTRQLAADIGGWKCALPSPGKLVLAPIYREAIHTASPCPVRVRDGILRVEPELAYVLARDLPARDQPYTPADVDCAIARTHLALELLESRYTDHHAVSFIDNLADALVNQGLFLGPVVDDDADCGELALQVGNANSPLQGRHPDGNPRLPLYWLAEYLRSQGEGLRAGQVVITGSYAGSLPLPLASEVRIRYGALGTLSVCFKADD